VDASLLASGRHSSHRDRVALRFCHFQLSARKPSRLPYPAQLTTLGDHVRKRRLDLGLLQREVAEKLGVTASTIWNWEANHSSPQLRLIPKVIAFLGYDLCCTQPGSFGERLLADRRAQGMSQKGLAYLLGVDPGTLGKWERGQSHPSERLLPKLEDLLAGRFSSTPGID
jgi:transcriptional regulator with XRE-family HTH domain